ncbi:MAG: hypothetical protein AABY45_08190, partial [Deltaproteobacteria bacterium]
MISNENVDVIEFNKLLSLWKEVYKWKMTSFVAIKTTDGPKLLIGRIIFDSVKPLDSLHFNFASSHIIAGREISETTIENIDLCIKNATESKLVSSKQTLSLYLKNSDTLGATFFPVYHPTIIFGPRLPSLIIRGSRRYELLSPPNFRPMELPDWDLKAADQPFDSLDELFTHLGFPTSQQAGDSAALEIIGSSPVLIADNSKITAGSAQVKCRVAEAADIGKIKFGYKIVHTNSVERASITGDAFEWIIDGPSKLGTAIVPTKDAPWLQGFLSYDGVSLHQWWIDDPEKRPNQRHALHEILDKDLGFVKKFLLTSVGRQNRSFEHGMALLLSILGFSISHYGKLSNMEDGPDIIAITPTGNVGVIECTTGLLSAKDKLVKLAHRTTLIKDTLTKAGHGQIMVQPIIVTAYSKKQVEAELERAGESGVAVVCKENIEELLRRVTLPPNPEA